MDFLEVGYKHVKINKVEGNEKEVIKVLKDFDRKLDWLNEKLVDGVHNSILFFIDYEVAEIDSILDYFYNGIFEIQNDLKDLKEKVLVDKKEDKIMFNVKHFVIHHI